MPGWDKAAVQYSFQDSDQWYMVENDIIYSLPAQLANLFVARLVYMHVFFF